jgi:hypothetical protein
MDHQHPGFWTDLAGKVGAPIFAATLVACLLAGNFESIHGILMGVGLALIGASHWRVYHSKR